MKLRFKGTKEMISKRLLDKFSQLIEDDVTFEKGGEHKLIKRLRFKLDKTHDEVVEILQNLAKDSNIRKNPKIFMFPIQW